MSSMHLHNLDIYSESYLHQYQDAYNTETEAEHDDRNIQLPSILPSSLISSNNSLIYRLDKRQLVRPTLQNTSIRANILEKTDIQKLLSSEAGYFLSCQETGFKFTYFLYL